MSEIDGEILATAAELADANLFPGALAVDAKGEVPTAALDLVCGAGFHGLFSPTEFGGLGASPETQWAVLEALAGGCLTTSFVWLNMLALAERQSKPRGRCEISGPKLLRPAKREAESHSLI